MVVSMYININCPFCNNHLNVEVEENNGSPNNSSPTNIITGDERNNENLREICGSMERRTETISSEKIGGFSYVRENTQQWSP